MKKITTLLSIFCFSFGFAQLNVVEIGNLDYSEDLSDIWGWVDGVGNEYALVGVYDGFSVVSLATPSNPTEVFFEPGVSSIWRDIKTWNNHAYVTTEGGDGLLIVDLSTLPGNTNLTTTYYTGSMYQWETAHNIYIDENGVAYIFGANYGEGGAIMLDLTQDPMAPVELGVYDDYYLHDGVVRGDTLYGSHINDGFQSIIDVSDKMNPQMWASWNTPNNFSHNCWFSDDGRYLFTTDEKEYAYIGAYDISDHNNIVETDRWQSNPGTGTIPHNTHFIDNYVVTSYYADGLSIVDVSNPNILVEVGNYDTSPNFAGNDAGGFHGAWGAYPWLPSGNILITDIEEGLFVLGPTYTRACFLKGNVTDSICGDDLNNVVVDIQSTSYTESTDIVGDYAFGTPTAGTYTVQFSKTGYQTKTISGVSLTNGMITTLNVQLSSANTIQLDGSVVHSTTALQGATVKLVGNSDTYDFTTNAQGEFSKCNVVAGTYDIYVSKWGYKTYCETGVVLSTASDLDYELETGYYDDFALDLGWTESGTASTGDWEMGDPIGTTDNDGFPSCSEDDASNTDCDNNAYVTGNGGGNYFDDDIDNGYTILTSPIFDLSTYNEPYISFYTWFANSGGSGTPNDYLSVSITNGTQTVELTNQTVDSTLHEWVWHNYKLNDYIAKSANMQLMVKCTDDDPGHVTEGGFDVFQVVDSNATSISSIVNTTGDISVYPNPFSQEFTIELSNKSISYLTIVDVLGREVESVIVNGNDKLTLSLDVEPGVYLVNTYVNGDLTGTVRLVKE